MNSLAPSRVWMMRAAFTLLILIIFFFHLLPLQTAPGGIIWPNLILAFSLSWSVRRPQYVPTVLLACMFFLADFLLQRPPGLWAMLALVACEHVKSQARSLRDASITTEIAFILAWIVGISISYRIILAILYVEVPPVGPALLQIVATVAAYPFVIVVTHAFMGVRKATPNDTGTRGS